MKTAVAAAIVSAVALVVLGSEAVAQGMHPVDVVTFYAVGAVAANAFGNAIEPLFVWWFRRKADRA